jgi:hypothetical protein
MRVVGRSITGTRNASDIAKAGATSSMASRGDTGSRTGTFAIAAIRRLSCSVWEEWGPGSSAETTRKPPATPV